MNNGGAVDRVIEQLEKLLEEAKRRGDYSEAYRLERKLEDAKKLKKYLVVRS